MSMETLKHNKTPYEVQQELRGRFRRRRKEQRLTQSALAERADVSLGSLKRFESSGEISLASLVKLAFTLGYLEDFEGLLRTRHYQTIQDVVDDARP